MRSQASFRTALQLQSLPRQLTPQQKILSLGSCFASNMGERLATNKFDILINPGGTLFNPVSIARLVRFSLNLETPEPFRRSEHIPVWHHLDLHSDMSRDTEDAANRGLAELMAGLKKRLLNLDWLILTFGTSRVYTSRESKKVVANCHKYPHSRFERRLLSVEEIHREWDPLISLLLDHNPNLQILLTVSPIRHTRDGLTENGISKALLRVFCEEVVARHESNNGNVMYFPAYEIMLDDLRDYRFYETDMIHPNEAAQQYIWHAFQEAVMTDEARRQVATWEQLRRDLHHRPLYPNSATHVQFLESVQQKLRNQPDYIDVSTELAHVNDLLTSR